MSRIAVLISGEYRTFGLCRKTMKFLDHSNVDIYFSTWNKTIYKVPKIGLYRVESVTEQIIRNTLGKHAVIDIEPYNLFVEKRYNSKMVHRWKRGFELIKNSNIEYDFILIVRPDLYFSEDTDHSFESIDRFKNSLASGWLNGSPPKFLNDVMFLSSYGKIKELFDSLSVDVWATSENTDWHTWWYSHASKYFSLIEDFGDMARCTFCRPWVNENHSYADISEMQEDWSDLIVLQFIDKLGIEIMAKNWPADVIERAIKKWEAKKYDRYK